jgi:urease accessory protein
MKLKPLFLSAALASAISSPAFAHVGAGSHDSFAEGLLHPVTGIDHLLAMVAVGFIAAQAGKRAMLLLPLAFMMMMAFGSVLGFQGATLPLVESGIAASVVVLGLLIAFKVQMPVAAAAALVGGFAVLHGNAHGAEMPAGSIPALYAFGFLTATAVLHGLGIGLGMILNLVKGTSLPITRRESTKL